ncbi:MAG: DUF3135 domain-containing protein [Gammaproteobacteria bacterium]|nr:DUF3135 domain-containing protein [Gammaproteobacteria bacterium]
MKDRKKQKTQIKGNLHIDDFEYWSRLAKSNPERFEEERSAMLAAYIDTMPDEQRPRLTQTQWKIDQVRSLAKNPYDALNRVSKLMWDELMELNKHQLHLVELFFNKDENRDIEKKEVRTAKILTFEKRSQKND